MYSIYKISSPGHYIYLGRRGNLLRALRAAVTLCRRPGGEWLTYVVLRPGESGHIVSGGAYPGNGLRAGTRSPTITRNGYAPITRRSRSHP